MITKKKKLIFDGFYFDKKNFVHLYKDENGNIIHKKQKQFKSKKNLNKK